MIIIFNYLLNYYQNSANIFYLKLTIYYDKYYFYHATQSLLFKVFFQYFSYK